MTLLDNLTRNASARGILPGSVVTVVGVKWHGLAVVGLTYKDPSGKLGNELRLGVNPRIPAVLRSGLPVCNLCSGLNIFVDMTGFPPIIFLYCTWYKRARSRRWQNE